MTELKEKIVLTMFCGCFAVVAGAVPPAYSNPLEVSVESGVTNTLSAWLASEGKSLDGYAELVKKGDGCLKIDSPIAFSGDIHVEDGTLWPMVTGALGNEGGKVEVHDGGRLYYDTRSEEVVSNPDFYGKRFFIEGTGGDGLGAVLCRCRVNGSARLMGSNLTITANAKISSAYGRIDFPGVMELDLSGNTLTLANVLGASGTIICNSGARILNGHIIADKCQLFNQNIANFVGGAENTVTLTNGATMTLYNVSGRVFWTAKFAKGNMSAITAGYNNSADTISKKDINRWDGPIVLDRDVLLSHRDTNSGMVLAGKISGTGGLVRDDDNRRKNFTAFITNPENDFTGKSGFDAITLKLPVNGALPDSCERAEFRGTHLVFQTPESNVTYSLPPAEFVGSGVVSNGFGEWKDSLVKSGDGVLEYNSMIGAELLDVQGGSIRFPYAAPGLHEGAFVDAENGVSTLFNSDYLITNNVATQLNWAYRCGTKDGWKARMLTTYSGYIWNRSGEVQRWTFAACVFEGALVYLDGKKILESYAYNSGDWKGARKVTVEVPRGAHEFAVKMYTTSNVNDDTWGGAYAAPKNEGWEWKGRFGIVFDRQGRDSSNYADYEKIADPGDGSLLTLTKGDTYVAGTLPEFKTMRFAPGTGIDLRGGVYEVPHLAGWPTVSSGSLTVTQDWTLPGDMLLAENAKLTLADGCLTFTEGAKVKIDFSEGRQILGSGSEFVIATATDGIDGMPEVESSFPGFKLKKSQDGKSLLIKYDNSLKVILR